MILTPFIVGVFGLIVGSFLNVVILRFGEKGIGGRSECPSCHTTLQSRDLVPVFSWIFLRGRCRYCKARISIQYPLVEASTGILFALIGTAGLPLSELMCALVVASLLVCIFVYDLRHQLIPDVWVWSFCAVALIMTLLSPALNLSLLFAILAGPLAMFPILFLWMLSRPFTGMYGAWMGFGDVKLSLGMGWLLAAPTSLGVPLGLVAVFLAFVIGAIISVCILLPLPYIVAACGIRTKAGATGYTMKSEVPFGPFLIISCFLVWFAMLHHTSIPFLI